MLTKRVSQDSIWTDVLTEPEQMKRCAVVVHAHALLSHRYVRPPVPLTSGIEAIKWRCIDVLHVAVRAVKATG